MAEAGIGFVDILPRSTAFTSSLVKQVSGAIAKTEAVATTGVSRMTRGIQAAFIGLGVVAVAAIAKGISATVEWAAKVRTLQRVTGQSAEAASTFAFAADKLGVGVDKLTVGFGLLSKNVVNGTANFEKYGIATTDAQGRTLPFDDVLGNVIDRFQELPPGIDQSAFAMNVFGRSGRNLIPILKLGREGLAQLREEAEKASLVLSQDDVDAAKELSIAQRELGDSMEGAAVKIGKTFVPVATFLVKVITQIVQVVGKVPTPVLAGVAAVTALTGAIAAAQLIGGFFVKTWAGLLGALHLTGGAATEAAAGEAAAATGAVALTGAATTAAEALTAEGLAATGATAELVGFGTTESGLLVPTAALTAEVEAQTVAMGTEGGAGLLGSLGGLSAVAGPAVAGLALITGGLIAAHHFAQEAHDAFQALVTRDLGALERGGRAAQRLRELARTPFAGRVELPGGGVVFARAQTNAIVEQNRAIAAARESLKQYAHQQDVAAQSSQGLLKSIGDLLDGAGDTQAIKDISDLTLELGLAAQTVEPQLNSLSRSSGQDFRKIGADVESALADPKTTVEQLPGIFQSALGQVRATMHAWRQDIVANFGGAQAALEEFQGQAAGSGPDKVSFEDLNKALERDQRQLHRWSRDFDTILKGAGSRANRFLQDMSANGLDSIGILDAVAQQPKKVRDEFLRNYNEVNKATGTIADQITDAFGKAADRIVFQLKNIFRVLNGQPPIKPKTDPSEVESLILRLQRVRNLQNQINGSPLTDNRNPVDFGIARGGVTRGASGFLTRGPVFQVGEAGTELVDPLESPRATRLRAQSIADALKLLGVGGHGGDMRVHVTVGIDDSGNLQVRRIAQDEVQREARYRDRVPA